MLDTLTPILQWNAASGADYYALAISKYPYGSGNIIYNPQQINGTSHQVPGGTLVAGEKYRWNMQAHNSTGWSAVSNSLYFQAAPVPTAPLNLRVTGTGAGYVNIAWDAPSSNGGSAITYYQIYRGTSSGTEMRYYTMTSLGTNFQNISNIVNGTTYYYRVTAVNAVGEGPFSNEVSGTPSVTLATLTMYVHENSASGPIISGAMVTGKDGAGASFGQITNSSGYVTITGAPGTWSFTTSKSGYNTITWQQSITTTDTRHTYLMK